MSAFITTYTGKHVAIPGTNPASLCIEDIAHSLAMICRGNGQVSAFYSVGQHCLQCAKEAAARGLSAKLVLAALLHDATECYLSDVPHPLKLIMPAYREEEDNLLALIFTKFLGSALTEAEAAVIDEIDHAFLWYDLTFLLHDQPETPQPVVLVPPDYTERTFKAVEQEYLNWYRRYEKMIK